MKKLSLLLVLFVFSACSRPAPTPPTESSSMTTETTTTKPSSTSTIEESTTKPSSEKPEPPASSSEKPIPVDDRANLVGTWEQDNQTLTIDRAGNWELEGAINSSGTFTVGADFDQTKMIKLYGFNENIGGIGTYFIANFNGDSSKMGFGYLGQFTRSTDLTSVVNSGVYQADYQTEAVDFSRNVLGTWTITEGTEFHNTWNYNPDGTFELFSQGLGEARTGTYSVKPLKNNWVDISYDFDDSDDAYTTAYHLSDGVMWEEEFEFIRIVRNTDPAFP